MRPSQFLVERARPDKIEVAESPYYWYPGRFGVQLAPEWFRKRLKEIHLDLEVTWHPITQRWLVWYKRPRIQHALCPGWLLLFPVETSWGAFVPLDERVLAAIYQVSARAFGDGRQYWQRIETEMKRDEEMRHLKQDLAVRDFAGERYDWAQIKNIGPGSKFANYHS
jgi:hypothetical protein